LARVTVQRSKQLSNKLKALREKTAPSVQKAMAQAADTIVSTMKRLAPVDNGDLRSSIGWTWGEAPKGSISVASKSPDGAYKLTVFAGSEKAFYARWVEFGTQPHALGKGSDISRGARKQSGAIHPGSRSQPFFFPSYRAHKKTVKRKINKAIRDAVKEVAAK
jgi:HK97 gp10 family phage protein